MQHDHHHDAVRDDALVQHGPVVAAQEVDRVDALNHAA
jgi:hypothetical protein